MTRFHRQAALALALMTLAGAASLAAPARPAQYLGPITAEPEHDTYGYAVAATTGQDVLCIIGQKRYFGPVTGNPERDDYAFATALFPNPECRARKVATR